MNTFHILCALLCVSVVKTNETQLQKYENITEEREGKFFSWGVGLVRFENGVCRSAGNLTGTCYTRKQCSRVPGIPSGFCARKIAVCCVIQKTCGATSSSNNTYFINPGYPYAHQGGTKCVMTVEKCHPEICQLRIEFLRFSLLQPDENGNCVNDKLTIIGSTSFTTNLCGENSGQHMYLDFSGSSIRIEIETRSSVKFSRYWNMRVSQISCDCPTKAPSGCLQYHTSTSGTIKSFNYGSLKNIANGNVGTRQIVNLNYGVCIAMVSNYCRIRWSQTSSDPYSFTVSGDTDGIATDVLGTAVAAQSGIVCTSDFVVVPNPVLNGKPLTFDRFCGNGFQTITTASMPYVLTIVSDRDEITNSVDLGNRGVSLDYQQELC